ncbi:MAG TPA: Hpt domain-containing protein, partial [Novosphingobium sp.]|nr:Hpt domain-containing protein [Novosphingobium sp.]
MTSEEIQAIFFVECEESLAAAEQGLAACKAGTQDADTINAVFRGVHSIKGGAGAFGFAALQAYTHVFETLLSDVREGLVAITPPLVDLLLRALDVLADHVTAAREATPAPEDAALLAEMEASMAKNAGGAPAPAAAPAPAPAPAASAEPEDEGFDIDLDALLDDLAGPAAAPAAAEGWQVHLRPRAGAMRNGSEPLLLLRELAGLGAVCTTCDTSAIPPLDDFDPHQGYLGWTFELPAEVSDGPVRDIFDFVGEDCPIA